MPIYEVRIFSYTGALMILATYGKGTWLFYKDITALSFTVHATESALPTTVLQNDKYKTFDEWKHAVDTIPNIQYSHQYKLKSNSSSYL